MRIWIYESLVEAVLSFPSNEPGIEDRVFQGSSLTRVPAQKPYMLYRVGVTAPRLHSEEVPVMETPFNVFIQDVPGDYLQIDSILTKVREQLTLITPTIPEARFIRCLWLGDSADVPEDPETGTISRFNRMLLIHKP